MTKIRFSEEIASHLRTHLDTGVKDAGTLAGQQTDLMNGSIQDIMGNVGMKFSGLAMPSHLGSLEDAAGNEGNPAESATAKTKAASKAASKAAAPALASRPPLAAALGGHGFPSGFQPAAASWFFATSFAGSR